MNQSLMNRFVCCFISIFKKKADNIRNLCYIVFLEPDECDRQMSKRSTSFVSGALSVHRKKKAQAQAQAIAMPVTHTDFTK